VPEAVVRRRLSARKLNFDRSCRRPPSSAAILLTMSQRSPSAARNSAFASAVSTTFESSYASDDSA